MTFGSRVDDAPTIGPKMADGRFCMRGAPHSDETTPYELDSTPPIKVVDRLAVNDSPIAIDTTTNRDPQLELDHKNRAELMLLRAEKESRRKMGRAAIVVASVVAAATLAFGVSQTLDSEDTPDRMPRITTTPSFDSEPILPVPDMPNGSIDTAPTPSPGRTEIVDTLFPAEPSLSEMAEYAAVEVDYATRIEPFLDTAERERLSAEYPEVAEFISPQNKIQVQLAASPDRVYAKVANLSNYAPDEIVKQYSTYLPLLGTTETINESGFSSSQDLAENVAYLREQVTNNAYIMYDVGYTDAATVYSAVYWNDAISQERTSSFLELKAQGLALGDSFRNPTVIDAFTVPIISPEFQGDQIFFATAYDVPADRDDPNSPINEKVIAWNVLYTVPSELRWTENEDFELLQGLTDVDGIGVGVIFQATIVN